jgi:hypothetical protein
MILRMQGDPRSEAGRVLVAGRWGPQRPIKLARELAARADELPDGERLRLIEALQQRKVEVTR